MKRSGVWQRSISVFMLVAAAVLLFCLVRKEGTPQVIGAVRSTKWFIVLAIPLYALWNLLAVLGWRGILTALWPAKQSSVAWLLASRFAAQSVNGLVPTGGLGGEALRSAATRRDGIPIPVSVVATAADNIAGVLGGLLFSSLVLGLEIGRVHRLQTTSYVLFEVALVTVTALALGQARRGLWWLSRVWKNTVVIAACEEMQKPGFARALRQAALWRGGERLLTAGEVWLGFQAMGSSVHFADACLLTAALFWASIVFFMIPSQWGAAEGAMVMLAQLFGAAPSVVLAVALVRRGRQVLTYILAWPLIPWVLRAATQASTQKPTHTAGNERKRQMGRKVGECTYFT